MVPEEVPDNNARRIHKNAPYTMESTSVQLMTSFFLEEIVNIPNWIISRPINIGRASGESGDSSR